LYRCSVVLVRWGLVVLLNTLVRRELSLGRCLLWSVVELLRGLVEAWLRGIVSSLCRGRIVPSSLLLIVVVVTTLVTLITTVLVITHVITIVALLRWASKLTPSLSTSRGTSSHIVVIVQVLVCSTILTCQG